MPIPSALFDIDGTLTSHNVWKGIMDFFRDAANPRSVPSLGGVLLVRIDIMGERCL